MLRIAALCIGVFGLLAFDAFAGSPAGSKPRPVLLGYSAVWRDAACPPADYDYPSFTHIARAFLRPLPDGSVRIPAGYFNQELETLAGKHGVKLLLSLGGGGGNPDDWLQMTTRPASRQKFLDNLAGLMAEHHYDGIDVDWEPPDPTQADGDAYGSFLKALRARFPDATLTTALPADAYQTRFIPWADVVANVDYVNVMAYDYSGPWSGVARHASNLYPAGDYPADAGHSTHEGIENLTKKYNVPAAKLVLGMNFWGYRFRVDRINAAFPRNAPDASDVLSFSQILALIKTGHYEEKWDAKANAPYLERKDGGSVTSYDSPESVRLKCEYARAAGCAGVMVWNIGSDQHGRQNPLMDAALRALGGAKRDAPRSTVEAQITTAADLLQGTATAASSGLQEKVLAQARAPLTGLSLDQLVTLYDELQASVGAALDARWQQTPTARP